LLLLPSAEVAAAAALGSLEVVMLLLVEDVEVCEEWVALRGRVVALVTLGMGGGTPPERVGSCWWWSWVVSWESLGRGKVPARLGEVVVVVVVVAVAVMAESSSVVLVREMVLSG
jgi:hypothetical protein